MTVPAVGSTDFMELWNQNSAAAERLIKKFLEDGLDSRVQADSDILSRIKVGKSMAVPVVRWGEEVGYQHQVTAQLATATLTISGYIQGAAVNQDNIQRHIRVGTILMRESDGLQAQVSAITGITDGSAPWACTVGEYGNSGGGSLSDDSGPVTWRILSEPWTDATEVTDTRALDRSLREVGTQIFAESFEILETRKNTAYEYVANEEEHQMKALMDKLRKQLANAVVNGLPYYSSGYKYANYTQRSTMCGLIGWPIITQGEAANTNVYVNKSSSELTMEDIDNLVRNMEIDEFADFNTGKWALCCHPYVHKYISQFENVYRRSTMSDTKVGYVVKDIQTSHGPTLEIVKDRYMRPDVVQVVNFSKVHYGPYKNDTIHRKELATQSRSQRWLISFQDYGLVVRDPRANIGTIYGISYA